MYTDCFKYTLFSHISSVNTLKPMTSHKAHLRLVMQVYMGNDVHKCSFQDPDAWETPQTRHITIMEMYQEKKTKEIYILPIHSIMLISQ